MFSFQDCFLYALNLGLKKEEKNNLALLFKTDLSYFFANFKNKSINAEDYEVKCTIVKKYIKEKTPIQYITGLCFFSGLEFLIERDVFIPQKDTEILVEKILLLSSEFWSRKKKLNVLEIGSGSGCSTISLAKKRKKWFFYATDINEKSLKIARNNILKHKVKNVVFRISDVFPKKTSKRFDIIFSNPPYISEQEYHSLPEIVKQQPKNALVAADDGLFFYKKILSKAKSYLKKKNIIFFEIGYNQEERVLELIQKYFPSAKKYSFKDLGNVTRVVSVINN